MRCEVRAGLERNCASADEEFDRLRKEMHDRIGLLIESEYQDLSARVQAAWAQVQRAEAAFNEHRQEHGCWRF